MSEQESTSEEAVKERSQAMFVAGLLRIAQNATIILTVLALLFVPIYSWVIAPPLHQLNARVERLEQVFQEMQKQANGIDKNMAVMVEKTSSIEANIKEIKENLKK